MVSFGKKALNALNYLGPSNLVLEQNISEARAELSQSEAIKRELEVDQANVSERQRLMQEMHDGICSNLTTALAVERQKIDQTQIQKS